MHKIPYYDTDERLIDFLTPAKADSYLSGGYARAIRSGKNGPIRRIYRMNRERAYIHPAAAIMAAQAAASGTTERVRNDNGVVISGPEYRQHRTAVLPTKITVKYV